MSYDFYIKQDDVLPELTITCINEETGAIIDLTSATAVQFHMKKAGVLVVDEAATFVDKVAGKVKYVWQAADTVNAGNFDGEFEVTFGVGPLTFPNFGYIKIKITKDLE